MTKGELNLLGINRGLVIAPAGCGKTQLIANALRDHDSEETYPGFDSYQFRRSSVETSS